VSYTIPDTSPKRAVAIRVGEELAKALEARDISLKALSRALGGTSHTKLWQYKRGRILPRLRTALEISEALAWPRIAELVREARSAACHQCGRMFVMEGGSANKRYCNEKCRNAALRLRAHIGQAENAEDAPERRLVARVKAELVRVRGRAGATVSRLELKDAIAEFEKTAPHSRARRMQNTVDRHTSAVEAFCNGCEPDGICRDAECPLRPVSPLPVSAPRPVATPTKAPGRWASAEAREAQSEDMRRRHAENPEWRENTRRQSTARWAALTPEERRQRVAKMIRRRDGKPPRGYEDVEVPA
jgi:transcriptional regulator with XRE-family HTH domain